MPEPAIAPDELVRNGGFEDPADASWAMRVAVVATATLQLDDRNPAAGRISARVDIGRGTTASGGITMYQEGIPIVAGRIYNLTMTVRAESARTIRVRIVSRTGVTYSPSIVAVPAAWTPVTIRIIAPDSDPNAVLEFGLGRTDETTWIDTVSLRPAPAF